jgi:hypothetical protein
MLCNIMKTLKKISLFTSDSFAQLMELKVLSEEEQRTIIGGGGTIDGFCYFYCMSYLTSSFNCSSMDTGSYVAAYALQYNDSSVFAFKGVSGESMTAFTSSYFNTESLSASHAVVIIAYDALQGEYVYIDPSDGKARTKSASEFQSFLGITGCK